MKQNSSGKHPNRTVGFFVLAAGIAVGAAIGRLWRRRAQTPDGLAPLSSVSPIPPIDPALPARVSSLQDELDAKDRALRDLERKNSELSAEYRRLFEESKQTSGHAQDAERVAIYRALEPILIQLPILAGELETGHAVSPEDVLRLLRTMPRRLEALGIEQIGVIGQQAAFDPRIHEQSPDSTRALKPDAPVVVVVPGYRYHEHVLMRAEIAEQEGHHG